MTRTLASQHAARTAPSRGARRQTGAAAYLQQGGGRSDRRIFDTARRGTSLSGFAQFAVVLIALALAVAVCVYARAVISPSRPSVIARATGMALATGGARQAPQPPGTPLR